MEQDENNENPSSKPCLRPDDVAEAIIYVLSTGPHVQVIMASSNEGIIC